MLKRFAGVRDSMPKGAKVLWTFELNLVKSVLNILNISYEEYGTSSTLFENNILVGVDTDARLVDIFSYLFKEIYSDYKIYIHYVFQENEIYLPDQIILRTNIVEAISHTNISHALS